MQLPFAIPAFPRWRYALAALAALLLAGYFFFGRGTNLEASLTVSPGDFKEQVSVSGTVTASKDVDLGFAANGRIAGTYARVGQRVEAGTILAEIENGDLVAAFSQKKAVLASLQAGTRPEQIAIALAAVTSAQAKLLDALTNAYTVADDAVHNKTDVFFTNPRTEPKLSFTVANAVLKNTVENDRIAIEPAFVSWTSKLGSLTAANAADNEKEVAAYLAQVTALLADANRALNQAVSDQATSAAALASYATTFATARANVNAAATALTNALSALTEAQKTLVLDQAGPTAADLAAAQADVENARATLAKTRVVASFRGVVTRMDAKAGEIVSPTVSGISMQSDGVFEIETYVPEVSITRIAVGNAATTTLDAYGSSVEFPAAVVAVDLAETVRDGVPTYKTTLAFLSADPRIRSGMTANIIITTGTLRDTIVIPTGAIGADANGPYVSVRADRAIVKRTVQTGFSPSLGQTVVLSGLSKGDVVLLSPTP
ncbi:hypothetical protein HY972_00580 [Candidatus Kaiserbacteria bacterium]|nr:hypothetical protein [Candidatus Kaiserbacteria bacterium]